MAVVAAVLATLLSSAPVGAARSRTDLSVPGSIAAAIEEHGSTRVIARLATPVVAGASSSPESAGRIASTADAALEALPEGSWSDAHRLQTLPYVGLTVDEAGLESLRHSPQVAGIFEDRIGTAADTASVAAVDAVALQADGATGDGRTVVVIDTGVDADHPYLGGRVVNGGCSSSTVPQWGSTAVCPGGDPEVAYGNAAYGAPCPVPNECYHGTHVAGIAAGAAAGVPGPGEAPLADIISIQVFSRFDSEAVCGSTDPCTRYWSFDLLVALDMVYDGFRLSVPSIDAINLSLGGGLSATACDDGPEADYIELLKAAGIATVVAAGNGNPGADGAMSSPGCVSSAISVAASNQGSSIASFSNLSPLTSFAAPGYQVYSSFPDENPGADYGLLSGTSMATPQVTGALALLRSRRPEISVDDLVTVLRTTGKPLARAGTSVPLIQVDAAYQLLVPDDPGTKYFPLAPQRLLDSRGSNGGWASTKLAALQPRTLTVTGGSVPTNAAAVVLNVTITEATEGSFLTVYPSGSVQPNSSNLNFNIGQNVPNLVTVPVGTNGQVSFFNSNGAVHVIADLVGYYGDATTGDGFTVAQGRILDSRTTNGGWPGKVGNGETRNLQVRGRLGVTQTATAAMVNITITEATEGSFLTAFPSGQSVPNASNLNFNIGQNIANQAIVKIGPDGNIALFNKNGAVHVVVDLLGYFEPTGGFLFHPLPPGRLLDSRYDNGLSGPWQAGETRTLRVGYRLGVADQPAAVVMNLTATLATFGSFVSAYAATGAATDTSFLNFGPGQNVPNLVTVPVGNNDVKITNTNGNVHLIADVVGYFGS